MSSPSALAPPPSIKEKNLAELAAHTHLPLLDAAVLHALQPAFDRLPFAEARRHRLLPLRDTNGRLLIALADPLAADTVSWAEAAIDEDFSWHLAAPADIDAVLKRHEASLRAVDHLPRPAEAPARSDDAPTDASTELSLAGIGDSDSPVVRLVAATIYDAINAGASDIHVETGPAGLAVRYRLDGVLVAAADFPGSDFATQVLSRIKVLADLDIAERRIPQDGRARVSVRGRPVDLRVSIMPSVFGEDAVLRILDKQMLADRVHGLRLDALGLDDDTMQRIRRLARRPHGMLLVTGPTGSGKTTTLYAALSEINSGQDKIVTIEDPVEYQLPGVLQIPVNEKKGLSFSRGLRSILRHDPDVILVGEIRDPETAQIAVQASLTGHLVFTTVHANNVFDVLGRSLHMDIEPYAFVSAINGIVAQRLLRRICPDCATDREPDDDQLVAAGLTRSATIGGHFRLGTGCERCRGTGYRGRKAIAEILLLDDELREMILRGEPVRRLREKAAADGTRFLRDAALDCARRGETTLDEVLRVVG